jgi:hypothetical protein
MRLPSLSLAPVFNFIVLSRNARDTRPSVAHFGRIERSSRGLKRVASRVRSTDRQHRPDDSLRLRTLRVEAELTMVSCLGCCRREWNVETSMPARLLDQYRAHTLWESRQRGHRPDQAELLANILSWNQQCWAAIDAALPSSECRRALSGARYLLALSRPPVPLDAEAGRTGGNGRSGLQERAVPCLSLVGVVRDVELALLTVSRSPAQNERCASVPEVSDALRFARDALHEARCGVKARALVSDLRNSKCGAAPSRTREWALFAAKLRSRLNPSSADNVAARTIYRLTAAVVLVGPDLRVSSPVTSAGSQAGDTGAIAVEDESPAHPRRLSAATPSRKRRFERFARRLRGRMGVAWTRELRDGAVTSVRATNTALDSAACLLWVFTRLVRPRRQAHGGRASAPHPCRLRRELACVHQQWKVACGDAFSPMRDLIGGGERGINAVRSLIYGRRPIGAMPRFSSVTGWDVAVALTEAFQDAGVALSFEMVRACCRDMALLS